MWEQILPGLRIKLFMTLVLGVVYPLAMTGISQVIFPKQSNGSLIKVGEQGDRLGADRSELQQSQSISIRGRRRPAAGTTRPPAAARTWGRRAPN